MLRFESEGITAQELGGFTRTLAGGWYQYMPATGRPEFFEFSIDLNAWPSAQPKFWIQRWDGFGDVEIFLDGFPNSNIGFMGSRAALETFAEQIEMVVEHIAFDEDEISSPRIFFEQSGIVWALPEGEFRSLRSINAEDLVIEEDVFLSLVKMLEFVRTKSLYFDGHPNCKWAIESILSLIDPSRVFILSEDPSSRQSSGDALTSSFRAELEELAGRNRDFVLLDGAMHLKRALSENFLEVSPFSRRIELREGRDGSEVLFDSPVFLDSKPRWELSKQLNTFEINLLVANPTTLRERSVLIALGLVSDQEIHSDELRPSAVYSSNDESLGFFRYLELTPGTKIYSERFHLPPGIYCETLAIVAFRPEAKGVLLLNGSVAVPHDSPLTAQAI